MKKTKHVGACIVRPHIEENAEKNVGAGPVSARRKNNGITLIALIITIIVMLILVAVSISIALNTGLFDSAGKATQGHKIAQQAEQELGSGKVTIDNKTYENIDDYVKEMQTEKISFYIIRTKNDNGDWETLEYTVKKGTTWEKFFDENKIYYPGEGTTMRFYIIGDSQLSWYGVTEDALGAYYIDGGGPIYETTGTYKDGPWIFPNDLIKDGVTYNFCV